MLVNSVIISLLFANRAELIYNFVPTKLMQMIEIAEFFGLICVIYLEKSGKSRFFFVTLQSYVSSNG